MFTNLSSKLKIVAWVILILGTIASLVLAIISFVGAGAVAEELKGPLIWAGVAYFVLGLLSSCITSWIIYAIAETHENTEALVAGANSSSRKTSLILDQLKNNEQQISSISKDFNIAVPENKKDIPKTPETKPVVKKEAIPAPKRISFYAPKTEEVKPKPETPKSADHSKYNVSGINSVSLVPCDLEKSVENRERDLAILVKLLAAQKISYSTYEKHKSKIESGKFTLETH